MLAAVRDGESVGHVLLVPVLGRQPARGVAPVVEQLVRQDGRRLSSEDPGDRVERGATEQRRLERRDLAELLLEVRVGDDLGARVEHPLRQVPGPEARRRRRVEGRDAAIEPLDQPRDPTVPRARRLVERGRLRQRRGPIDARRQQIHRVEQGPVRRAAAAGGDDLTGDLPAQALERDGRAPHRPRVVEQRAHRARIAARDDLAPARRGGLVGAVEEARIINGASIRPGMVCLGLPSSGLHTNGFSLARKAAFEIAGRRPGDRIEELGTTVAEALLAVHKSYAPVVHPLLPQFPIHGMAHITGGGLPGNLNRVLPKDCDAWVRKGSWPVPPVFDWLGRAGDLDREDMYSAFNMGIGFVVVVEAEQADQVVRTIERLGEKAYRIGEIRKGEGKVRLTD